MNKILEFIRKHSKITVILIILCSLLPLIIVLSKMVDYLKKALIYGHTSRISN